jgi:tetratricopeptide (TPR) repeat protein
MVMFKRIKDVRLVALAIVISAIVFGGILFSNVPDNWVIGDSKDYSQNAKVPSYELSSSPVESVDKLPVITVIPAKLDPQGHSKQQQQMLVQQQFADAAKLLQIGHFKQSITVFHKVLRKFPDLPEAHINLGFAMLGLGELKKSVKSFNYALKIQPQAADAYYGLALVAEKELEFELAMGAMRTYLHLRKDDAYVAKARAALQYWEIEIKKKNKPQNDDKISASNVPISK